MQRHQIGVEGHADTGGGREVPRIGHQTVGHVDHGVHTPLSEPEGFLHPGHRVREARSGGGFGLGARVPRRHGEERAAQPAGDPQLVAHLGTAAAHRRTGTGSARDFFAPLEMKLPATLPPGEYVLKAGVEDKLGATTDQQRLTFTIGK